MKFAIIGLGKIGKYHIRDFIKYNCQLIAILVNDIKKSEQYKKDINTIYNININCYDDINNLLQNEKIDLLVISSPTETHYKYVKIGIENNINIFCEKPFIYNHNSNNINRCSSIINELTIRQLKLNVNTQWVYGIKQLKQYIPNNLTYISLYMEHYKEKDNIDFYTEILSHMNSIIIYLLDKSEPTNIYINKSNYPIIISFIYNNVMIEYKIGNPHNKKIIYQFNNTILTRHTDKDYNQSFIINNDKKISIIDPFSLSIKYFLENKSIINNSNILENISLTDKIIKYI